MLYVKISACTKLGGKMTTCDVCCLSILECFSSSLRLCPNCGSIANAASSSEASAHFTWHRRSPTPTSGAQICGHHFLERQLNMTTELDTAVVKIQVKKHQQFPLLRVSLLETSACSKNSRCFTAFHRWLSRHCKPRIGCADLCWVVSSWPCGGPIGFFGCVLGWMDFWRLA